MTVRRTLEHYSCLCGLFCGANCSTDRFGRVCFAFYQSSSDSQPTFLWLSLSLLLVLFNLYDEHFTGEGEGEAVSNGCRSMSCTKVRLASRPIALYFLVAYDHFWEADGRRDLPSQSIIPRRMQNIESVCMVERHIEYQQSMV